MKTLLSILLTNFLLMPLFSQSDPYLLHDFKKGNSPAICVGYSADGKTLIAGYNDGNAVLISIDDEKYGLSFGGHWKGVKYVALAPSGKFMITAGDNTIKCWSPEGEQLYVLKDITTTIMSADLDSSGRYIVAGSFNKTFKLFDALKGEKIADFRGHTDVAMTVCFNSDGSKIASAAGNGEIMIWDRESQSQIAQLNGQSMDIYSLAFSRDGKYLASGSKDKTINIYDLYTNKLIRTLKGHTNQVMDVEFSNDGLHLISCSFDNTIRLWEIPTGKCLYTFIDHSEPVLDLKFSPDGKTFASASFDKSIKIWDFSPEIMVDYYYSPQVNEEMQDEVFLPKQKGESKEDFAGRQAKAKSLKMEIYDRYYQKYLSDLKNGSLPTL
ncbi:MAG: WD40 repeat domain-containing protein [Bacteroidales bacterium]|nr:WD40 repeat domain-containing protein [Bacteroidales bacterium]MCB9013648.1 WD40 repeat domain-containing protein [Bacteroidales bacterium]